MMGMKQMFAAIALMMSGVLGAWGADEHPFFQTKGYPEWSKMTAEQYRADLAVALEETEQQLITLNQVKPEEATFENIFVAYARVGENLLQAQANAELLMLMRPTPELKEAQLQGLSLVTRFMGDNAAHFKLNKVIKAAAETPWAKAMDAEHQYYMKLVQDAIRRMGADLTPEQIKRMAELHEELLKLEKEFEQRLMAGHNNWHLVITDAAELKGLPESWMNTAAANAVAAGIEEPAWVLTLADNTAEAALVFCENEETRRKCWLGYNGGGTKDQIDTEDILHRTFELRHELATLMGFRHFADMQAEQRMTGTAERALAFVDGLLTALKPAYDAEMAVFLKKLEKVKGGPLGPLQPWNVFHYTQRMEDEPGMNPALVMPYLPMDSVLNGMMQIWSKMLGVDFEERKAACVDTGESAPEGAVEVWHPDVRVFEMRDAETGVHLGTFYLDVYAREEKRPGSWCAPLRVAQPGPAGEIVEPNLAVLSTSIAAPEEGFHHLLQLGDVSELFHEFGHLMHMLLGHTRLPGTPSADVEPDFVEVPSMLQESWVWEPEALALYTRHCVNGKPMPGSLAERIKNSSMRSSVEPLVRSLCLAKLDLELNMHYHDKYRGRPLDEVAAELLAPWRLPYATPEPCDLRAAPHCMSDTYAASYYTYAWSEALAADMFSKFKAEGVLNPATGAAYRKAILTPGSSKPAAEMFRNFMGRDPNPDALLQKYLGK